MGTMDTGWNGNARHGIALFATSAVLAACSVDAAAPGEHPDDTGSAISACSTKVTTNTYVGPDYWGTIKLKNTGSSAMHSPTISFEVPSGVTCDYDASGWKHTQSGRRCIYARKSSLTIAAGASYTFHYSTNSSASFSASDIEISDPSCGGGSSGGSSGLVWRKASLTVFESYPDPGSEECIEYNGCTWAGQFAFVDGKQSESWVASHDIAAVHSKDAGEYKLKTLRLVKNGHQIDVKVYDECSDSDCDGCCTQNAKPSGFLIDLETHTAARFGVSDGEVDWTCLDCD